MIREKDKNISVEATQTMVTTDPVDRNFKKRIAAIRIHRRLTLAQRKVSNVLLHNAGEDLPAGRVHHIRIEKLAAAIDLDPHDPDPLREVLKTLTRTVLEWTIVDEDDGREEWGATTLLAQAAIKHGSCVYAYSPELCEKLGHPETYPLLNFSIQHKFGGGYALALYETCLRYRRAGTTDWIGLDPLKRLLGISDNEGCYQDFRKFNSKVIKPAVRRINDASDLWLEIEYRRDRRRVTAVRFQIGDNPRMPSFARQRTFSDGRLRLESEPDAAERPTHARAPSRVDCEWLVMVGDGELKRGNA